MKLINKLKTPLLGLALGLALVFSSQAAVTNFTITANSTNIIADEGWNISSIQLISANNLISPITVNFYDSATNVITYTNAAYTNYTTFITNVTSVITNSQGFLQTNIYPGQWTEAVSVPANTNNLPVIASVAAASGSSATLTANINTVNGLVARATTAAYTNLSVVVTYEPAYTTP